jgi:hypothetical protein
MRRKNQLDAVKLKFIDVGHSACFRLHYAHHQEYNKGRQTAYGVLQWSCSSRPEGMRWIPCALDGCGNTIYQSGSMIRVQSVTCSFLTIDIDDLLRNWKYKVATGMVLKRNLYLNTITLRRRPSN